MMKLRRRNRNAKSENDTEYLVDNNTEHNPSKVLLKSNFRFFELIFDIFRYVDWYGNLQKVHGKHLKLVLKQL